ncbi:MAG: hypothetical protein NTX87_01235 [Planctomycetota bacterium]|nr:hypothetical protein [Planctomycetota bacterium]
MKCRCLLVVCAAAGACMMAQPLHAAERAIPAPLPDHPGNVFLAGEAVSVTIPVLDLAAWRVTDSDGKTVAEGKTTSGRADIGKLPVGWYEIRWGDAPEQRASAAVLQPLAAPTPTTSPIGIDVAMAWFYKEDRMPAVANLCTLAGINWVRDRLAWGEVEPKRGEFAPPTTKYDASARIQAAAGLRVLQVNHSSPAWANPNGKRFPEDLRDAHRFYREMARRWAGQVVAFEPWNEADIVQFGGHTGAEMASFQKAAALGLKAGNAGTIACLNVFATPNKAILADLGENQAWPYFDTFNLHHYAKTDDYPRIYAAFREVSAGRPLWTTEFSMPVPWSGDEKRKEPSDADLRIQAERVAQVFAAALHEGVQEAFYFLLPHYVEGKTQFGIVRPDLTPRPAYVALAAVGRLLADARPMGRLTGAASNVRAFLFQARPDGRDREVLVAWTTGGAADLALPAAPEAVLDHLGRPVPSPAGPVKLSAGPVFALLAKGTAARMPLDPPPAAPPRAAGDPSPVVLQAVWPRERVDLKASAYRVSGEKPETVPVFAYNFSDKPVKGELAATGAKDVQVRFGGKVSIAPGDRKPLDLVVDARGLAAGQVETVRITGDFGPAGKPVLSLRLMAETK